MRLFTLLLLLCCSLSSYASEYIVVFKNNVSEKSISKFKEIELIRFFGPKKQYALIRSTQKDLLLTSKLKLITGFMHLSPNEIISLPPKLMTKTVSNSTNKDSLWWQKSTTIKEAHQINRGDNELVVAILDTGVDYLHNDLKNNIKVNTQEIPGNGIDDDLNGFIDDHKGFNFFSNSGNGMDDNGHGTHCAGLVAANGELTGISPGVKILPLKFLNHYGQGDIAKAIDAIAYAVDHGAKIISNSYGNPNSNQAFLAAIEYAQNNNVLFFAAAGNAKNDNDERGEYPANYHLTNVVSVGAINQANHKASFSNYGQLSVDIYAPGENIYSLDVNNRYEVRSGTSMATPIAAGIAALIWSEYPSLSSMEVMDIMKQSSKKNSSLYTLGQTPGHVDALFALERKNNQINFPYPRSQVNIIDYSLESESPYQNNTTRPYLVRSQGATHIAISFSLIDIENGYDYLQIESTDGQVLKKLTGSVEPGFTQMFSGPELVVRIISDNSETKAGFRIDKIKTLQAN